MLTNVSTSHERSNRWLQRLVSVIESQLSNSQLSNQDLAAAMGVSERQLFRKLQQLTKRAPQQFLRDYRMLRARQLLQQGHYQSIRDLAAAVGYTNVTYFNQHFQRAFGKKPQQFIPNN